MQRARDSASLASHPVTPCWMTSGMFPRGVAITGVLKAIGKKMEPDVVTSLYGWTTTLQALNQYCNSSSRSSTRWIRRFAFAAAASRISRASGGSWHGPDVQQEPCLRAVRRITPRKNILAFQRGGAAQGQARVPPSG